MRVKLLRITTALLVVQMFLVCFANPVNTASGQEMPERDEIVWAAGYWQAPTGWSPVFWEEAFGTFFMYEPLFAENFETGELLPHLGETMEWVDPLTLEITLREDIKWTDGTPITSEDVIFTFTELYAPFKVTGFNTRVESMEAVSDRVIQLHLKDKYPNSRVVWNFFTLDTCKILPKHVWSEIKVTEPYEEWDGWRFMEFKNNWLEDGFPEEWKVASGPYLPHYVSPALDKEIYIRNEDWWGIKHFGTPVPKYIGHLHYKTNFAMNSAFSNNEIDWYGGYYPRIWELFEENPNINTYTLGEPPYYLPISGMIELVFNHQIYPFNELWLRQAMAYAINYEDISIVSASGYLQKARIGYFDDRSPMQKHLYDPEIEAKYAFNYDPDRAEEILADHAFQMDGVWYTNDVPAEYRDMPGAEDALPDEAGINVKLSDWDIIVVYGWSDSMMQTTLFSTYFSDIGIKTTPAFVEYGTYVEKFESMDYELQHQVMGFQGVDKPVQGFGRFLGTPGAWTNWSDWPQGEENSTYDELVKQFETTLPGSPEEKELASQLQEIIASELPCIPIAPNGYWYTYNTKYWTGWPNEENRWIQAVACWQTSQPGAMQRIIMNLEPPKPVTTPETTTPVVVDEVTLAPWGSIGVVVVFLTVSIAVATKKRR